MRLAIVLSVLLALVCTVQAAPFLVCDTYTTGTIPTYFLIQTETGVINSTAAQVTGGVRLEYDMAPTTAGAHSWTVKACVNSPEWGGELCSDTVPFAFVRPSSPSSVLNIRLSPTK